jgi:hypothetical protein
MCAHRTRRCYQKRESVGSTGLPGAGAGFGLGVGCMRGDETSGFFGTGFTLGSTETGVAGGVDETAAGTMDGTSDTAGDAAVSLG